MTPRENGGVRCDVDDGPCACGAWHRKETEMAKLTPYAEPHVIVVEAHEVADLSNRGYQLQEVVMTDVVRELSEDVPNGDPDRYPARVTSTKDAVLREPRFVMRLHGASAMAAKQKQLEERERESVEAAGRAFQAESKLEGLIDDLATAQQDLKKLKEELTKACTARFQETEGKRRLELDLGKIRQAIGDLRLKEIIG